MASVEQPASADVEVTLSVGGADLSRFLGTRSYIGGRVVKMTTSRWVSDIAKSRTFTSLRAAFNDMRQTIRDLPWADAGILLKKVLDSKDRVWYVRTYADGGLYVMAFPPEDGRTSEHI